MLTLTLDYMPKMRNMQFLLFLCSLGVLFLRTSGFKCVNSANICAKPSIKAEELSRTKSVAVLGALMTNIVLTVPSVTHAVDSSSASAVSIPLIVSGLVMVPFLYYQQALRPQKKTIEITTTPSRSKPQKKGGGFFGKRNNPEPEPVPEPEPKKKTNKFLEKLQKSQKSGF